MMGNKVDYTGWSKEKLEKELGKLRNEESDLNTRINAHGVHKTDDSIFGQISLMYRTIKRAQLRILEAKRIAVQKEIANKHPDSQKKTKTPVKLRF